MEQSVDIIIKETITETVNVDQELQSRVKGLVNKALDAVEEILDFGLMDQKMIVVRTLLGAATRNLGKDFTSTEQSARIALDNLFESMRSVDAPPTQAITARAYDPNEGSDNGEVSH